MNNKKQLKESHYQIHGAQIEFDRYGAFSFVDQDGNYLGHVEGQTITEPFYKFNSNITDRQILIIPLSRKHYALKVKDETLAIVKFERVDLSKVINLILSEKQFYRLEEVIGVSEFKYIMFYPKETKLQIEIYNELKSVKISLGQRLSCEPFICLIPIILDQYRKPLFF